MSGAIASGRHAAFLETYAADPDAVAPARHAVGDYAERLGADEGALGDLGIAVSEACTNVVLHAYREGADDPTFAILAEPWGDELLRITVTDAGDGMRPRSDSPGLGLGLPVMSTLAETFDLRSEAGAGTTVTMTFRLRR